MNNTQNEKVAQPKKWKMMLVTFMLVYPVINIIFFLFGELLIALPQLLRTLVLAIVLVPLLGTGIPILQKLLRKWIVK